MLLTPAASAGETPGPNLHHFYAFLMVKSVVVEQRNLALAVGRKIDLISVVAVLLNRVVVSHVC